MNNYRTEFFVWFLLFGIFPNIGFADPFTDIGAGLPGVYDGAVAWGDYDNDGDLDILITGFSGSPPINEAISRVYQNDAGVFTDTAAGLPGVYSSSVAWGDYDNDGDLDILLTGFNLDTYSSISAVYRNDSGTFVNIVAGLPGVSSGSVAWGDYDNDGDLDILLNGNTGSGNITHVYRNDAGSFLTIGAVLPGVFSSSVAWGDYDNDGDLDILLTGDVGPLSVSWILRNDSGSFTDIAAGLPGVYSSSAAWGDYDNDGDLDFLLTGGLPNLGYISNISNVYRNDAGAFVDIGAGLPGVTSSSVAWGDYDNDGDLDILLTGWDESHDKLSIVYRNDAGSFVDIAAGLLGVINSSVAWGDYDNDNDLDILLTGDWFFGYGKSMVLRNDTTTGNTAPTFPGGLAAEYSGSLLTLNWSSASDAETPGLGLSYNLRVGTIPGGSDICAPLSNSIDGFRRVVQLGNVQQNTTWSLDVPGPGPFYWSVQAIDGAFAGSPFAAEQVVESISSANNIPFPRTFDLSQNVPNPFNPQTTIAFELPKRGSVSLRIFDLSGRLVKELVGGEVYTSGNHEVVWKGRDDTGRQVASGTYFYRLEAGSYSETKRMVLIK